ncbi:hypothetical protein BY996DRAFT_95479 [Phakopsora pachyrhizi]|nr:hypothetical protein BY996DRAFT_95479 [Phakopsora pachyrhizi]
MFFQKIRLYICSISLTIIVNAVVIERSIGSKLEKEAVEDIIKMRNIPAKTIIIGQETDLQHMASPLTKNGEPLIASDNSKVYLRKDEDNKPPSGKTYEKLTTSQKISSSTSNSYELFTENNKRHFEKAFGNKELQISLKKNKNGQVSTSQYMPATMTDQLLEFPGGSKSKKRPFNSEQQRTTGQNPILINTFAKIIKSLNQKNPHAPSSSRPQSWNQNFQLVDFLKRLSYDVLAESFNGKPPIPKGKVDYNNQLFKIPKERKRPELLDKPIPLEISGQLFQGKPSLLKFEESLTPGKVEGFLFQLKKLEEEKAVNLIVKTNPTRDRQIAEKNSEHEHISMINSMDFPINKLLDNSHYIVAKYLLAYLISVATCPNKGLAINQARMCYVVLKNQIQESSTDVLFIANNQVKKFFSAFVWKIRQFEKIPFIEKNYARHNPKGRLSIAFNSINWKKVFLYDERIAECKKVESILTKGKYPPVFRKYAEILETRFYIRNLFLVYSTVINKIFSEGHDDLAKNFGIRQKEAIAFFDLIWSSKNYVIENDNTVTIKNRNLPFPKVARSKFLNNQLRSHEADENFIILPNVNFDHENMWGLIFMWLAKHRIKFYRALFPMSDDRQIVIYFKEFITSLICSIL